MNILLQISLVAFPAITSLAVSASSAASGSSVGGSLMGERASDPEGPMLAIPGVMEMWPVLAILLLIFGGKKLPELARAMGSSVTQFKKGLDTSEDDEPKSIDKKPESTSD